MTGAAKDNEDEDLDQTFKEAWVAIGIPGFRLQLLEPKDCI